MYHFNANMSQFLISTEAATAGSFDGETIVVALILSVNVALGENGWLLLYCQESLFATN